MGHIVQLFETGDGVLAVGVWLLRACGRRLTQTRLPACRTGNRWCWKMRHLSEALKPPSNDPPHTSLSLLHTHSVFPSRSLFPPWMSHFLCQDYLRVLVIAHASSMFVCFFLIIIKLLNMDNGMRISDIFSLIVGAQGALGHLPVWVFVHLDGASRWQGWVWASPGNGCRQPRNKSHFLRHSLSVHL